MNVELSFILYKALCYYFEIINVCSDPIDYPIVCIHLNLHIIMVLHCKIVAFLLFVLFSLNFHLLGPQISSLKGWSTSFVQTWISSAQWLSLLSLVQFGWADLQKKIKMWNVSGQTPGDGKNSHGLCQVSLKRAFWKPIKFQSWIILMLSLTDNKCIAAFK